jgi:hypothetical protein
MRTSPPPTTVSGGSVGITTLEIRGGMNLKACRASRADETPSVSKVSELVINMVRLAPDAPDMRN